MLLSVGAVAYGFCHSLQVFNIMRELQVAAGGPAQPFQVNWDWFLADGFRLQIGYMIDNLAAVMLIVVTGVSLLVQIYTHGYMREDPGYSRFYCYLSLFTGSMLGLVVATNLFQMYFFWELVGVCSYFLIGFWMYKPTASFACMKAFVVNRVGDFGFLVGILFLLAVTWGFWQQHPAAGILTFTDVTGGHADITGALGWALDPAHNTGLTQTFLTVIATLILLGPIAKSAQAPLHVWLPDAMEGPTPISALIHAATMVAAGVYLVARAYPLWLNWSDPLHPIAAGSDSLTVVAWVGGITAFMAATIALTQFDIKRALAWSTVSQLGYMFVGLGCGAFSGGMFHLFNHAFFKAMLFLCSGAVIHALHDEQDMRKMGGLWKHLPITGWCFLIGTISISGVPGFSGFFSKDMIIDSAFHFNGAGHEILGPLMVLTAGLTAFYMFRMFFMTFTGDYRGEKPVHAETLSPLNMPLIVLAVPSVISGYLGFNMSAYTDMAHGAPTIWGSFLHFGHYEPEPVNSTVMGASILFSLVGIGLAYAVYCARSMKFNEAIAQNARGLYLFSLNKWYWDELYASIVDKVIMPVFRGLWTLIDSWIVDGMIVNQAWKTTGRLGNVLRYSETGSGQVYAMVIFACAIGISIVFFFCGTP